MRSIKKPCPRLLCIAHQIGGVFRRAPPCHHRIYTRCPLGFTHFFNKDELFLAFAVIRTTNPIICDVFWQNASLFSVRRRAARGDPADSSAWPTRACSWAAPAPADPRAPVIPPPPDSIRASPHPHSPPSPSAHRQFRSGCRFVARAPARCVHPHPTSHPADPHSGSNRPPDTR